MKIRQGFVSNSSSSSFVVITAGNNVLCDEAGSDEESFTLGIDEVIEALTKAKEAGATVVEINYGGGYDG